MYEWCGDSSFQRSGYADRTKEFASYSKPVFLSEFGCNLVTPRGFSEIEAIYGPDMTDVWSGGVVYEWTQENNNYGLVKINDGKAELLTDYHNLQKALAKAKPKGINMDAFNEEREAPECPQGSSNWKASSKLPPTPSEGACTCMRDNLACLASEKIMNAGSNGNGSSPLGAQIDMLCGMVSCNDISTDGEKGQYGSFSFCSPTEKLSWLYHLYLEKYQQGNCDFDGYAVKETPKRNDIQSCAKIRPSMSSPSDNRGDSNQEGMAVRASDHMLWLVFIISFIFATVTLWC